MQNITNSNAFVISFYIIVFLIIFLNRKKFQWEGIIGIRRTSIGLKKINYVGKKYKKIIKFISRIGVVIGIIGIFAMTIYLFYSTVNLFVKPSAPPSFTPLLPGVKMPGTNIRFPLIESFIAIIIAVIIHEFSHGIVGRSHGLKPKSTGFALLGPIPAAFVELDEKKIRKMEKKKQLDIFGAGPWSNILLAGVIFLLLTPINIGVGKLFPITGFEIVGIEENSPAMNSSIKVGDFYYEVNNKTITSISMFKEAFNLTPEEEVVLKGYDSNNKEKIVRLKAANESGKGKVGITITFRHKNEGVWWGGILIFLVNILYWTGVISLGLGLANLLPLGPLDGGRMFSILIKNKKVVDITSIVIGVLLIINIFLPILRSVF